MHIYILEHIPLDESEREIICGFDDLEFANRYVEDLIRGGDYNILDYHAYSSPDVNDEVATWSLGRLAWITDRYVLYQKPVLSKTVKVQNREITIKNIPNLDTEDFSKRIARIQYDIAQQLFDRMYYSHPCHYNWRPDSERPIED